MQNFTHVTYTKAGPKKLETPDSSPTYGSIASTPVNYECATANKMIGRGYNAINSSIPGGKTGSDKLNIPISPLAEPRSKDTIISDRPVVKPN